MSTYDLFDMNYRIYRLWSGTYFREFIFSGNIDFVAHRGFDMAVDSLCIKEAETCIFQSYGFKTFRC